MTLWAIEFGPGSRAWINHFTIRASRREAWQAAVDLDSSSFWWDELHEKKRKGLARAVKVRIERATPGVSVPDPKTDVPPTL